MEAISTPHQHLIKQQGGVLSITYFLQTMTIKMSYLFSSIFSYDCHPLMFLDNLIDDIIPPLNEKKGHIELVIEVAGHSLLILGVIYLLHRIIHFYSKW